MDVTLKDGKRRRRDGLEAMEHRMVRVSRMGGRGDVMDDWLLFHLL